MITIDVDKTPNGSVAIGRQGEHDFNPVYFIMNRWAAEYPTGSVTVVYERPDGETYPVVTAARPAGAVWLPNLADLSVAGGGRLECRITVGAGLGKSATVPVCVVPAIGLAGTVPITPMPDWTYTVADNARRAENAATAAEKGAAAAAEAAETGKMAAAAAQTAADGIQETVQAELTAAKESGIFNGPKGDKGDAGAPGPAGHTPVKGIDYYTEEEKAELVNLVLEALSASNGGE